MSRIFLTAATDFYVDEVNGSDGNSGFTAATAKQTLRATVAMLKTGYDFGGQNVLVKVAKGVYQESLALIGQFVGQNGPGGFQVLGSGTGTNLQDCMILPPAASGGGPGANCVSVAWGASLLLGGFLLNGSYNQQDLLAVGQGAIVVVGDGTANAPTKLPVLCFGPAKNPANHITLAFGRCGLQVSNNYSVWCAGQKPQCHLDADDAWAYYDTNGTPGLMVVSILDNTDFIDSFVHCSNADLNIQAVGWAGYGGALPSTRTCVVEKCGVIDTGSHSNANYFPGTIAPLINTGGQYL